jgi:Fe-S-cluster containining protein
MSCAGRCCAVFTLPWSHETLIERQHEIVDGEQLAAMVLPLTGAALDDRAERFGLPPQNHTGTHHFTCRNWDEDTKLCNVYDDRPWLCREYPYLGVCQHGCGYELTPIDKLLCGARRLHPITAQTFPA